MAVSREWAVPTKTTAAGDAFSKGGHPYFFEERQMNLEISERRREEIRRLCAEQNISIAPYGNAWWIRGDGVDFVVSDLAWVQPADLRKRRPLER